jgi:uncharacterized protein YggE
MLRLLRHTRFLGIALPLVLAAQDQPSNRTQRSVVRASGEATVAAKPDRAQIDIGVVTESSIAEVLSQIKAILGTSGSMHTINYSLSPSYNYSSNGLPSIKGYQGCQHRAGNRG